jgi:CDP-diacylglycerol--glycerol-3-phosphate 3-phosphatidyltransferase
MLSSARQAVGRAAEPLARMLLATGLTANAITLIGLAGSVAAAALVATGRFGAGAAVFVPAAFLDLFDGLVARRTGTASRWGAFVDSLADRAGEAALLIAIAYRFRVASPRTATVALAALALSLLVSYTKARAESLGYRCEGGFAERPERCILIGAGLLIVGAMEAAMWGLAAVAGLTVVQRILAVRRQARPEQAPSRS